MASTLETIFALLRHFARKSDVEDLLRVRNLRFSSASWDDLLESRVAKALSKGHLTEGDLLTLVREFEEFGRQRVFLHHRLDDAPALQLSSEHIQRWLESRGVQGISHGARIIGFTHLPADPVLVDVRQDLLPSGTVLTVKEIEQRYRTKSSHTDRVSAMRVVREIELEPLRVVNVVRIHHNGLLEVRIGTQGNDVDFAVVESRLLEFVEGLISGIHYFAYPLQVARSQLDSRRNELSDSVRIFDGRWRGIDGFSLGGASSSRRSSLFGGVGVEQSLALYREAAGATAEELFVDFLANQQSDLSRDVGIRLAGRINEFTVTTTCRGSDYERILAELRALNREIPEGE